MLKGFVQFGLKGQRSFVEERKKKSSAESKMIDQQNKASTKTPKNQDSKKASHSCNNHGSSKKQDRKGHNPTRFTPVIPQSSDDAYTNTRVCKNSACRSVLSMDEPFCRSCSCCFCHQFDHNKDSSLWLVCNSDNPQDASCGLACHIECAFQHRKVGVVNLGQFMELDGSYWCAACGKVSGILGCWKQQLCIAKDARHVDVLCQRISLSYRLLSGTSRFKALHEIVKDAKSKLEAEVGAVNEISSNIGWGSVSRLCVAGDVQKLCADAITKTDEWLANTRVNSPPAACKFFFENVMSSCVSIVLVEIPTNLIDSIKGYKLSYWRTQQDPFPNKSSRSFSREQKRIVINDLQPCTEYTFKVVSFTDAGDLCKSEASCMTKSVDSTSVEKEIPSLEGIFPDIMVNSNGARDANKMIQPSPVPRVLDLNVALVPDLNVAFESSGDEDNGFTLEQNNRNKNFGNIESKIPRKRSSGILEETFDCDSTLVNGSPSQLPVVNLEECVKTIRWLECKGHIKQDFRLKFLTWFSLRSTEDERQVVNTFIRAWPDEPKNLAGQLVDSFSDIITVKRPRHSFSSNLP